MPCPRRPLVARWPALCALQTLLLFGCHRDVGGTSDVGVDSAADVDGPDEPSDAQVDAPDRLPDDYWTSREINHCDGPFERSGDGVCGEFLPMLGVDAIPICDPTVPSQRSELEPPGGYAAVEVTGELAPVLHCELATGCPEFQRGVAVPSVPLRGGPLASLPIGAAFPLGEGAFFARPNGGAGAYIFSYPDGELLWVNEEEHVSWPGARSLADGRFIVTNHDVTWATSTWASGDCDPPCATSFVTVRDHAGRIEWARPFSVVRHAIPHRASNRAFAWVNELECFNHPDVPPCPLRLVGLDLDTGEVVSCHGLSEELWESWPIAQTDDAIWMATRTGFWRHDIETQEDHVINLEAGGVQERGSTLIRLEDGRYLGTTSHGLVLLDEGGELIYRDRWVDEPIPPALFSAIPAITQDGWVVAPSHGGVVRFHVDELEEREFTLDFYARAFSTPTVMEDGVVIVAEGNRLVAHPNGEYGSTLWTMDLPHTSGGWEQPPMLVEDDMMIVFDGAGQLTWWTHSHGRQARTPSPGQGWNEWRNYEWPEGPFDAEPSEPQWTVE